MAGRAIRSTAGTRQREIAALRFSSHPCALAAAELSHLAHGKLASGAANILSSRAPDYPRRSLAGARTRTVAACTSPPVCQTGRGGSEHGARGHAGALSRTLWNDIRRPAV